MAVSDKTWTDNSAPDVFGDDYNGMNLEPNNAISGSGQTLTILDRTQLTKAQAIYASRGDFYQEGGGSAADVYVLEGASNPMVPNQPEIIALRDGMRIRWRVVNANTGASTIDVAGLGAKPIVISGQALVGGELSIGEVVSMEFDLSNDNFNLFREESSLPFGYISGLTIATGTDALHDIDVAIGVARDFNNTSNINLVSILTKQIDANWVAGTDQGGFPSGLTLTSSTWYRFFLIRKNDGTVDGGFDTDANATNLLADATDYSSFRRIGWVFSDGSSEIESFLQRGNWFLWDNEIGDITGSGALGVANRTITAPPNLRAQLQINGIAVAGVTSIVAADINLNANSLNARCNQSNEFTVNGHVFTDSSSQISTSVNNSSSFSFITQGWQDVEI